MPEVVGKTLDEARRLIEENELSLGNTVNVYDNDYPAGYVVKASVEADTEVEKKNTSVDIWVSRGKETAPESNSSAPSSGHNNTPSENSAGTGGNQQGQNSSGTQTSAETNNNAETPQDAQNAPASNTATASEEQNESPQNDSQQTQGGLDALLGMRGEQENQ